MDFSPHTCPEEVMSLFGQGSVPFFLGLFLLFVRWPVAGIIMELYGSFVLFRSLSTSPNFLCNIHFLVVLFGTYCASLPFLVQWLWTSYPGLPIPDSSHWMDSAIPIPGKVSLPMREGGRSWSNWCFMVNFFLSLFCHESYSIVFRLWICHMDITDVAVFIWFLQLFGQFRRKRAWQLTAEITLRTGAYFVMLIRKPAVYHLPRCSLILVCIFILSPF